MHALKRCKDLQISIPYYRVETKKVEPLIVKNELVITPRVNKRRRVDAVPKLHLTPH